MRKILLAAVIAGVSAAGLFAGTANAITVTTAKDGVRAAADATNLIQDVRWVCRGYGRRCFWVSDRGYGAYGYYPRYRRNYYRPY